MTEIDSFAAQLLEEAKRFLEIASSSTAGEDQREANLHAALILGCSALEAHLNAACADFAERPELAAHEKGLLLEQEVKLEDGAFVPSTSLKIFRVEDRLSFLYRRFSGMPLDTSSTWWGALGTATKLRNGLTHPKTSQQVSVADVQRALQAIIDALDALYLAIYKRHLPAAARGLQSKLSF